VQAKLREMIADIVKIEEDSCSSAEEKENLRLQLLRRLESRLRELADDTKPWKNLKQKGRLALSPELQAEFDDVSSLCASRDLFINPNGELESNLTDYGIEWSSDRKRGSRRR